MLATRKQRLLTKLAQREATKTGSMVTAGLAAPLKGAVSGIKTILLGGKRSSGPLAGTRRRFHKIKEYSPAQYEKMLQNPATAQRAATLKKVNVGGKERYVGRGTTYGGIVGSMRRHPLAWGGGGLLGYMLWPQGSPPQQPGQAQQFQPAPIYPYERTL